MKKLLFIPLAMILLLSGCANNTSVNKTPSNNTSANKTPENKASVSKNPKNYVQYFDKTNSKIFKDCSTDSDCKLELLNGGCAHYEAINKNNLESDLTEYFNKQKELTKDIDLDCMMLLNPEILAAICENNVCTVKNKQTPAKTISSLWKSSPQGDFVEDTRDPGDVCKEIQSQEGLENCDIIISKESNDESECADGMSVAGCFACKFECQ